MTLAGGKQPSRDSVAEIAAALVGVVTLGGVSRGGWIGSFAIDAARRVMHSEWGRDVARLMAEADGDHASMHYLAIADVRCGCCDLRFEERDEYTCCSQYGFHNHGHTYDAEALRAARLCRADCPRWWTRPDDLTIEGD